MSGCVWDGSKLLHCYITLNVTMPGLTSKGGGYSFLKHLYDSYQALFDSKIKSIPFRQTCRYWSWMVTQGELAWSTLMSLGGCLVLATLNLMMFTANALVSLLCIFNILGIVLIVGGIISLMG